MDAMMLVEFKNNRIKPRTVEKYACAVLNHFFKRPFKRDVEVIVKFVKQHPEGQSGFAWEEEPDVYVVEVARGATWPEEGYVEYQWYHQMETLAHELVHVKQFIRKEFNAGEWSMPYLEQPSEIEVAKMQKPLYEQYYGV